MAPSPACESVRANFPELEKEVKEFEPCHQACVRKRKLWLINDIIWVSDYVLLLLRQKVDNPEIPQGKKKE